MIKKSCFCNFLNDIDEVECYLKELCIKRKTNNLACKCKTIKQNLSSKLKKE